MRIPLKIIAAIIISMVLFSCKEKDKKEIQLTSERKEIIEQNNAIDDLESDFSKWYSYFSDSISLSSDFIGLSEKSDTIGKRQFLESLTTGDFIPINIKSSTEAKTYKLSELSADANNSIRNTIKNESLTNLKHYNLEGQQLPKYEFVDLNGNHYTNENTIGKTIFLKTWFLSCIACIEEFPELNEYVKKHEQSNDVLFLGLALDRKKELERFLQKKQFDYQVIPNQREYIEKLGLQIYPTHIIVDEKGLITKVFNSASEMIAFYEKEKEGPNH